MNASRLFVAIAAGFLSGIVTMYTMPCEAHHPRAPRPLSVATFDADEGERWVLESTIGVVSSDAPTTYVCAEAFGEHANFRFHFLSPTTWVALTDTGLFITRDGCTIEALEEWIVYPLSSDAHRDSGRIAYGRPGSRTSEIVMVEPGAVSGLALRVSLTVEGRVTGLRFLDEARLLVSAIAEDDLITGAARLFVVDALSGERHDLDVPDWKVPRLLDVGPDGFVWAARKDWDVVVAYGTLRDTARQFIEAEVFPSAGILAYDEVFIAGLTPVGRGLTRFSTSGEPGRSDVYTDRWIHCIHKGVDSFYLCGDRYAVGYDLGRIEDDRGPQPLFDFWQLEGPRRDCPQDSPVAMICPDFWDGVVERIGPVEYPDASEPSPEDGADDPEEESPEPGNDEVISDEERDPGELDRRDEWWRDGFYDDSRNSSGEGGAEVTPQPRSDSSEQDGAVGGCGRRGHGDAAAGLVPAWLVLGHLIALAVLRRRRMDQRSEGP
jgi:hypothetical protein